MNTSAIKQLRKKLAQDEPVYGMWISLDAAAVTEIAVVLGLDWIVIDAEHGHLDWHEIIDHIRAAVRSDTVVLVRISELNIGLIKRTLDIGADGIVIPWMETVEQLEQAVWFSHYPPNGRRGFGGERATGWGKAIAQAADQDDPNVIVMPIIESVQAKQNIDQLCKVDGIDMLFIGPADYSATAGYPGQWEGPGVADQLLHIKDTIRRHGKHCGLLATSNDNLIERRDQGFRVIGFGMDTALMMRSLEESLSRVGRKARISTNLKPG